MKLRNQTRTRRTSKRSAREAGDVPRMPKRTYETSSAVIPQVTDHCTIRGSLVGTITAQATTAGTAQYAFTLGNSGIAAGPWDQYRFKCVRISIVPQNNAIGLVTNSTTTLVPLHAVIDYDDSTALSNATNAQAYNNCVTILPGESMVRTFVPRMAVAAYSGAFTSYANTEPLWIDYASNGVYHYGVKVFIPGAAAAQTLLQSWEVSIESWIEFRNVI